MTEIQQTNIAVANYIIDELHKEKPFNLVLDAGQTGATKTFTAEQASALYHILVSFGYKDECKGLDTKLPFELIDIKKEVL